MSYSDDKNGSASPSSLFDSDAVPIEVLREVIVDTEADDLHPIIRAAISAITEEDPDAHDTDPIFRLVRKLKGIPLAVRQIEADSMLMGAIAVRLREVLSDKSRLPLYGSVEWNDEELLTLSFEQAWTKCRYAEGENLLSIAFAEAMEGLRAFHPESPNLNRLLNLAFQLQISQGKDPIIVAVNEETARLLGVSKVSVGGLVWKAQQLGYLIPVCSTYNAKKGQARTFMFDLTKVET